MRLIKILIFTITLGVVSMVATITYAQSTFSEGIIDFGGTELYLRPDASSPIVYTLNEGSRIGVYSEEGEYARIVFGNYRGYILRDSIFVPTEDAHEAAIYGAGVRLRRGPGEYSDIIAELEEDTDVEIDNIYGDWFRIKVTVDNEDLTGFVAKEYVLVTGGQNADMILRPEMEGSKVKTMQIELKKRGFLSATATGYYGPATKQAVGDFQVAASLSPDGIAGQDTLKMLYADNGIKAVPRVSSSNGGSSSSGSSNTGYRINFFTSSGTTNALASIGKVYSLHYSKVYDVFPIGSSAKITIVATGQSFNIKRNCGTTSSPHADVEPRSSNDAAVLKSALGGSYVSARCPIWITIGGATYAASIYSVPHAEDLAKIGDNNFPGVFCVHFTDSRGNTSGVVDSNHQAAIAFALSAANG